MAYASWSVVFGEQPSASKWNILGTNDAFFDTQVGSGLGSTSSTVWWQELGRTTLGADGSTITVAITARKYLFLIGNVVGKTNQTNMGWRFNGDTGNNYSTRFSVNGAADTTATTNSGINTNAFAQTTPHTIFGYVVNIAAQEKLVMGMVSAANTAGAATAPDKEEYIGKWANTSAQITSVSLWNNGAGTYTAGDTLVVMGHD